MPVEEIRVIIFSFSFHRDCASKVVRKDFQAQEAVRFVLSSMKSILRMKPDQEFEKCIAKAKKLKGHIPILS